MVLGYPALTNCYALVIHLPSTVIGFFHSPGAESFDPEEHERDCARRSLKCHFRAPSANQRHYTSLLLFII